MKKLKLKQVKWLGQGHLVNKWQSQVSKSGKGHGRGQPHKSIQERALYKYLGCTNLHHSRVPSWSELSGESGNLRRPWFCDTRGPTPRKRPLFGKCVHPLAGQNKTLETLSWTARPPFPHVFPEEVLSRQWGLPGTRDYWDITLGKCISVVSRVLRTFKLRVIQVQTHFKRSIFLCFFPLYFVILRAYFMSSYLSFCCWKLKV